MDLYSVRNQLAQGKSIYEMPLRVTFYARVSTDKDAQLNSLDSQIMYYTEMINKNTNWTYVSGYVDEGISGKSTKKRKDFLKMINDAKMGKFDLIITKEISRFSRNTIDSLNFTKELLASGVGIIFEYDNINSLLPDSELRLTIMSSIAQDELRKLSERTKFGFKRSIEKGVVLGNSKIWGYKKNNGKLEIDKREAKTVRMIFDMYAVKQMGMRTIAETLFKKGITNRNGNQFSIHTIRYIITNPKYKGFYCGNRACKYDYMLDNVKILDKSEWVTYKAEEDVVPAIVSEELWEKANQIYQVRSENLTKNNKTGYSNKYSYSGKVVCGEHKTPYHRGEYKYKSGNKEYWACKKYKEKGKVGCDVPILYTKELDLILKEAFNKVIENRSEIIQKMLKIYSSVSQSSLMRDELAEIQVKINDTLRKKDRILDLNIAEKISDDEFQIRNETFNEELENLKNLLKIQKEDLEKSGKGIKSITELRKIITKEIDFKDGINKNLIDALLDQIIVYKGNDKNTINLKIFFVYTKDLQAYTINRKKNSILSKMDKRIFVLRGKGCKLEKRWKFKGDLKHLFDTRVAHY